MRRSLLGLCAFALLAACAPMARNTTVCPEYRGVRCMTGTRCSMDRTRGCEVCRCEKAYLDGDTIGSPDEQALPPGGEPP
jgi:hypothetical protein